MFASLLPSPGTVRFDPDLAAQRIWPAISVIRAPSGRPAVAAQPPVLRRTVRDLNALVMDGREATAAAIKARETEIERGPKATQPRSRK